MTRRQHTMPFGAEVCRECTVFFGLWAPAAQRVDLCLEHPTGPEFLPMTARDDGWFRIETERAQVGSLYRFRIDERMAVPDPASRFQPQDVHGPSEVIEPGAFVWEDTAWHGRPWDEVVIYELHVGTYTAAGTFEAVIPHLPELADLGVTAVQLMPVADFPGARNWGYDGVYPFAPDSRYGRPEQLKQLVQAAHACGLMVFLDVVYNHFGPQGNYLRAYAPQFFTARHHTPWGDAVNFDGADSRWVRRFFVDNALFWLHEYHFDGLRLDAVHAIRDDSRPDILEELAQAVREGPGRHRPVHLILENDDNAAHYLSRDAQGNPQAYVAQWNDDFHHTVHVLMTGETAGYYQDYQRDPIQHFARVLRTGFAYQGEPSSFRDGRARGEPSDALPPTAFVNFLQNHDQVGNRAFGERITDLAPHEAVRAATALLLGPCPPLLFMGQEWGALQPFLFFCELEPPLGAQVVEERCREFERFAQFSDVRQRAHIPDPTALTTFERSVLDWAERERPPAQAQLALHRELLHLRRAEIVPRLAGMRRGATVMPLGAHALSADWVLGDGAHLSLLANLGSAAVPATQRPPGRVLHVTHEVLGADAEVVELPPWSVGWYLHAPDRPAGTGV